MSGTTIGILVIVVAALAAWLGLAARAARHPGQDHLRRDPLRGLVQGGQHVGGGRSVAPHHRDAPVPEGGGNPPTTEEED